MKKNILDENELFIFDLDGVVYEGQTPIAHAVEAINKLSSHGKKIAYFTNNATLTPESYRDKLAAMGIESKASQIYTSALICANSLKITTAEEKKRVFIIGEDGLLTSFKNTGFTIINSIYEFDDIIENSAINTDMVIAGLDRFITYRKLAAASLLIERGAEFYASNTDATLPDPVGFLPGAGSIVAFLSTCSGKSPDKIFGKPYPEGIFQILKDFSSEKNRSVIIGDRLNTDILCGKNAQINTAVALTGVTKEKDMRKLSKNRMPNYILNNLSEIFAK